VNELPTSSKLIQPELSYPKLISLAVHEFRTPASVVGGYLRMLQRDSEPLSDRQRKMIDEAAKSCARLVELISELSDVSKLDSGLLPLGAQRFDLFRLVYEVADGVHEADDREVRLRPVGLSDGASINGDAARLRNAFHAVFRSVLREKVAACTVVVDCRIDNRRGSQSGVVVVTDEGNEQAAYDAPRAPFDEKRGGLGLALAIARRVVEAHGGNLWSPAQAGQPTGDRGAAIIAVPLESL
jgi:signal transduction histidine kinase